MDISDTRIISQAEHAITAIKESQSWFQLAIATLPVILGLGVALLKRVQDRGNQAVITKDDSNTFNVLKHLHESETRLKDEISSAKIVSAASLAELKGQLETALRQIKESTASSHEKNEKMFDAFKHIIAKLEHRYQQDREEVKALRLIVDKYIIKSGGADES